MKLCLVFFAFLFYAVDAKVEQYKFDINCYNLNCKRNGKVCGIRTEGEGFRLRLFEDECALLNYKCAVKDNFGYDVTDMEYCSQSFRVDPNVEPSPHDPCEEFDCLHPADDVPVCGLRQDGKGYRIRIFKNKCQLWEHSCHNNVNFTITDIYICKGLELSPTNETKEELSVSQELQDNEKSKLSKTIEMPYTNNIVAEEILNEPEMEDYAAMDEDDTSQNQDTANDKKKAETKTIDDDFYIASEHYDNSSYLQSITENEHYKNVDYFDEESPLSNGNKETDAKPVQNSAKEPETIEDEPTIINANQDNGKFNKIIVVRGQLRDWNRVNETIDHFFSASHVFDMPIQEMPENYLEETTRRRLIRIAGPIKVYIPKFVFPKNITGQDFDKATLHSCFHKCPKKCPPTYAPVCGLPGRVAREPSLMFLNHCFMDVAQCKQFYENKSPTSISSAYQEMSFVFCLGDKMNYMYHFLPLLKTLQHMGRLPKKGKFHYRLTNLKFFNTNLPVKNPNLMG